MQKNRHRRFDLLIGPEPVAALKHARDSRRGALAEDHRGWDRGPVRPEVIHLLVEVGEAGFGMPKELKELALLFWRALLRGNCEVLTLRVGQRVQTERGGIRGGTQAEAAQQMAVE